MRLLVVIVALCLLPSIAAHAAHHRHGQAPIQVTPALQPPADGATSASNASTEEPSEFWGPVVGHRLKITDSLIALFTLGLFFSTVMLWNSAEKALRHQSRAQVYFKELQFPIIRHPTTGLPEKYKFITSFANCGGVCTRRMVVTTNWLIQPGEIPTGFEYPYVGNNAKTTSMVLAPQAQGASTAFDVAATEMNDVIAGRVNMYFWGKATYWDAFAGVRGYETRFCFKVIAESTGGGAFLGYSYYGDYNGTEQDPRVT